MPDNTIEPPSGDLLVQLVQANYDSYAATTQGLIKNYEKQVADLEATLAAIREGVMLAFDGAYMPTPARIKALLWPADRTIDLYRDNNDR